MDYEVILRALLAAAYAVMCASSLIVRSKLSGSLVAKRFSALAAASAIGLIATLLRVLGEDVGLLGAWRPSAMLERILLVLGVPVPLIIMALALASLAHTYSRFAS